MYISPHRDLIAPCGINCSVCKYYLSKAKGLYKSKKSGCIVDKKLWGNKSHRLEHLWYLMPSDIIHKPVSGKSRKDEQVADSTQ